MTRLTLILALTTLTACATIEGAGQDISEAGDAISEAARSAK